MQSVARRVPVIPSPLHELKGLRGEPRDNPPHLELVEEPQLEPPRDAPTLARLRLQLDRIEPRLALLGWHRPDV